MKLRIMQIIKLLLDSDQVMTINNIADALSVSNKTIRNDFKTVESVLESHHLKLVKKTGVGVRVEGDSQDRLIMLTEIKNYKSEEKKFSSNDRKLYILNQLLNNPKTTTIGGLEDELYISRPSVYKDLEKVRDWLKDRDIELIHEPRVGLKVKAGEKRIRKSLFDLFLLCNEHDELIDLLDTNGGSFNYYAYEQKQDIAVIDFDQVQEIVKGYESALDIIFTANGLARLTIKFCITINRIMDGHLATMRKETMTYLMGLARYSIIDEMANEFSDAFDIDFTEEEKCYLFGIVLGTRTHYDQNKASFNQETMAVISIITREIVENTKKRYSIKHEESFYNGLLHHLKTVTNKIQYGLDFHNDFLEDIKTGYGESYAIAFKSKRLFEEFYSMDVPDDEIGYIALHIASAIERSKEPLKVCVIYNNSYSEIKLMLEYLHNRYKQLDLQKVIPKSLYLDTDLSDFDLLIATEDLKGIEQNRLVVLPSILLNKDMSRFGELLDEIYETHNKRLLKKDKE